jgi:FlaG/FlaF family flagellin (archaellin)
MKRLKKKGVSPFIAAVLLVVIAVTIGAVIANWVREYVGGSMEDATTTSNQELKCGFDVDYKVVEVDDSPLICINNTGPLNASNTSIEFMAENNGDIMIEFFSFRIIGDEGIKEYVINGSLDTGSGDKFSHFHNATADYGSLKQLKIIPSIKLKNSNVLCADHALTFSPENIKTCPLFS